MEQMKTKEIVSANLATKETRIMDASLINALNLIKTVTNAMMKIIHNNALIVNLMNTEFLVACIHASYAKK